ncbi:hypothetical protein [Mesorhizobium sp. ANAO-SY3R2]|uniref:hypothetical protein n=1 Tax=Mesorhizobium sp. ANAO-SY3R2 TaxID=3166644 RepID=UPI00366F6822
MSGAIETLRQNLAALNVTSPVGAEVARERQGNYRGEAVASSSAQSQLQDAAEELGMSVAHRADKRSLDRREVRQGQSASLAALARIADYYDKLPDMPNEDQLRNLVEGFQSYERLMEKGGHGRSTITKDDILAMLQKFDPDVTHQFAALDIAREFFSATHAGENFQMLLGEAHAEYDKGDLAREVRAGFVGSEAAMSLDTDPAAAREAYRSMLRESHNMGQLFATFRKFDILSNFNDTVGTFMAAAGRDLASTGPSTDPAYLHALISELAQLKKMQSVVEVSLTLMQTTDRLLQKGEQPTGDAIDLAGSVLTFASNAAAGPMDARAMLSRYDQCTMATQLAFANGLRALHSEIPDGIVPSPQARLQQGAAIVGMLDTLVRAEEREFENRSVH